MDGQYTISLIPIFFIPGSFDNLVTMASSFAVFVPVCSPAELGRNKVSQVLPSSDFQDMHGLFIKLHPTGRVGAFGRRSIRRHVDTFFDW